MQAYGLNLRRVASFIAATFIMGGRLAPVTLQVAETIQTLHNDEDGQFIIHSFAYGAEWDSIDPPVYVQVPNYVPDVYEHKMDTEIETEVQAGRYVAVNRDTVVGIAAIGIVDKEKSGMVKVRVIHDLSRPTDQSVNAYTNIYKRKFATVKQACAMIQPGGWMEKCDLSKAYRSIPTAPRYWRLHVLEWQGIVYADMRLPFGNRAAPGVFDRLTQSIVRATNRMGFQHVLGYIDDFWVTVGPEDLDLDEHVEL
jgi:hypothetical protein